MKIVTERRMAGTTGAAISNISSSYPRTDDVIASPPYRLKIGHRIKAEQYQRDIEKTERSIAALHEHLHRTKLLLAAIMQPPSSQCETSAAVPLLD
jgi:hypothetical protein